MTQQTFQPNEEDLLQNPSNTLTHVNEQLAAALEVLRVSEARYRLAFETSFDAIAICRMDNGMFVDVNPAFHEILGYSRDELVGQTLTEEYTWTSPDGEDHCNLFVDLSGVSSDELSIWCDAEDWSRLTNILLRQKSCRDFEACLRKKNGDTIWGLISASAFELEGVPCVHFVTRDISRSKADADKIEHLSLYDSLTSLPNRKLLMQRINQLHGNTGEDSYWHALLSIDLDRFENINEAFGLSSGDLLLKEVAQRILRCIRANIDTPSRLGADKFTLLLEDLAVDSEKSIALAKQISERILKLLSRPYSICGEEIRSTASIGIAIFNSDHGDAHELLQQSVIAQVEAKHSGGNSIRIFAPELRTAVEDRASMDKELRADLASGNFLLYYQPQFAHDCLIGAEALLRWPHETRGIISPGIFLPLAENNGLILPISNWVLHTAFTKVALWRKQGCIDDRFRLAVNISAHQFRQPEFADAVISLMQQHGVNPANIELELTETALVEDVASVVEHMQKLQSTGIRFALDDFGTGYSCLSYLKQFPLDKLKIDISFVREILSDPSSKAIARAIIGLSHALGLDVIAEGVESVAQKECLQSLGCQSFQGYLMGRPLPETEFEKLLLR